MKKLTNENFIGKAIQVHENKYDYSKVEYINAITKVCIICPVHGEFWQIPNNHLRGKGCPKCKSIKLSKLKNIGCNEFIKKAKLIHGTKYDYGKVEYINNRTKVCIICPEHGEFYQMPHNHLNGKGCPKCAGKFMNQEYFIEKAKKVHNNKYDYSKVNYVNNQEKVCIICPEHGEFWQTPHKHLLGQGCPKCASKNNISELKLKNLIENNSINYIYQKKFKWLGLQSLDFYLPDYNIAIECQGLQHFEPVNIFGGKNGFIIQKERDCRKYELCKKHNIKILYFTYDIRCSKYNVLNNEIELIKIIRNNESI